MEAFRVRRARVTDLEDLSRLFDAYRVFYDRPSDIKAARKFMAARLRNKDSIIYVAVQEKKVVGFTQIYPSFSSVSMKPLWIMNDLYVQPGSRRAGVGSMLMERAESDARKKGAKGLVLETQRTNPAQKLYERRGWQVAEEYLHYSRVF